MSGAEKLSLKIFSTQGKEMVRAMKYTGVRAERYEELKAVRRELGKTEYAKAVKELNRRERSALKASEKRRVAREKKEEEAHKEWLRQEAIREAEREKKREEARIRRNEARKLKRQQARVAVAIPFDQLVNWASERKRGRVGAMDRPFALIIRSAKSLVQRTFNFKNIKHLENWVESVEKQRVVQDSENYKLLADLLDNDEDIFDLVIPSIRDIQGGCLNANMNTTITKQTWFYDLTLFCPSGRHNNCGFRVIENILDIKLNYADLRKELGIKIDEKLTPEQVKIIYTKFAGDHRKFLIFIDDEFNDEINPKYHYIYVHNEHYYRVMKACYINHNDVRTKRGFLYWDIETRPTDEYVYVGYNKDGSRLKSYLLKDTILCAYYKRYQTEEYNKITFRTNETKTACRQFLDWLSREANDKHYYHAIAHNGSRFDMYFLLANLTEEEQLHTRTQLRGYSIIGAQYKSHLFKDSCCFLTASLDSLCTAFKVKQAKLTEFIYDGKTLTNKNICFYKPELSFNQFMELQTNEPEYWKLYEEYCMYDCIGLQNVWTSFRDQITALTDKLFQYKPELKAKVDLMGTNTIGSLSKKILENTCLCRGKDGRYIKSKAYFNYLKFFSRLITDEELDKLCGDDIEKRKKFQNKILVDDDKIDFVKKFKRGGISHSNQAGKHTHSLISYDIASQYPASMIYMLIPTGESEFVDSYSRLKHGYYHLKNLKFETKYNFKPVSNVNSDTKVLEWDTETIEEIYLDSFMIKYLQSNYGLKSFDVVKGLVSMSYVKGEEIFGEYVNTLYEEKKAQDEYKKIGSDKYNPALRECIKLFLNSLSGKLVEDPSRYFSIEYTAGESKEKMNGISVEMISNENAQNTWIGCGVMVYSYSKRLLFEYVRCLPDNSKDVIHIETDSIYFNKKYNDSFTKNVAIYKQTSKLDFYPVKIGADLGNVKVEKDTDKTSYFLGKKFYCIGNDIFKIKGIPLKTIDEYGNDVPLVDEALYEEVYNWKAGMEPITRKFMTLNKSLFNNKREAHCGDDTYAMNKSYISSHSMSRTITPNMKFKLYE
jgi:hypothetical protein